MGFKENYEDLELTRDEVDASVGATVLEFGTNWCGYCRGAQPLISAALSPLEQVRHIKVEDGPGRPLGRSYKVRLWPTLIFLHNGKEVARVVRPNSAQEIEDGLRQVT